MTTQSNATFTNPRSGLNGERGYATLHERQNGEWFTIITVGGEDLYCEDWEVEFDESPIPITRSQVSW